MAEAFAKHILCLFFSTKAFMCYVLNFFWKKAFMCLFTAAWCAYFYFFIRQKPSCAYIFRQKPSCAMCLIFSKKSLHVLNWPCAYKKMSVLGILGLSSTYSTYPWQVGFQWRRKLLCLKVSFLSLRWKFSLFFCKLKRWRLAYLLKIS